MGNLTNRKEGSQNQAHVANNLNQYATAWNDGSSRTLSYDLAGNMTSDGVYTYTYDAKNQLVGMSGAGKTAAFSYDPQGRRISKSVTGYSEVRFAYDGWYRANEESDTRKRSAAEHLVAELNSSGTVLKKYTWGLDASGTLQGAGGVGGLLMIEQGSAQYYPVYDGRQNIVGLHNSSGTLVAWYVPSEATTCHGSAMTAYDPFGRLIGSGDAPGASGAAALNPFRFSTKYTDHEMEPDLVYYGLRYYHAEMGRFLNRDPIEEAGGLNLYGFVGNGPTNYYDYLGMEKKSDRRYADTDGDGLVDRVDQKVGTEWKQLDGLDASANAHNLAVFGSDEFQMNELGYNSLDEYMSDAYGAENGASLGDAYASSGGSGDPSLALLPTAGTLTSTGSSAITGSAASGSSTALGVGGAGVLVGTGTGITVTSVGLVSSGFRNYENGLTSAPGPVVVFGKGRLPFPTNAPMGTDTDTNVHTNSVHRIGGNSIENLRLKEAEKKARVIGISVLLEGSPQSAALQMRTAFPNATRLHAQSKIVASGTVEAITATGFLVIPSPTSKLPNHATLSHPDGVEGFSDENLARLSAVLTNTAVP